MRTPARRTCRELRRAFRNMVRVIRILRGATGWPEKGPLCLAVLVVLASSVLSVLAPAVFKQAIDGLAASSTDSVNLAPALLLSAYVVSLWLERALNESRWIFLGRTEQASTRRLSLTCFEHILRLPLRAHFDRKTGALSRTMANGIVGYRIALQHAVFSLLPAALQIPIMGAVVHHLYRPVFLLILGGSITAYIVAFTLGAARTARPMRAVSAAEVRSSAAMTDAILNYESIKYFAAEPQIQARFDESLARCERRWLSFYRCQTANGLVIAAIFGLSFGSAMLLAGAEVRRNAMTIGDFVLVNAYMLQIIRPLEALGFALRDIVQATSFLEKLVALMDREPECIAGTQALSKDGTGELVFDRVRFSYDAGEPVLDDLSFSVAGGRTVAIVGASGSGKSTLVRLLVRLLEPDSGRILLDGIPIHEVSPMTLRKAIAVVPQDTLLLNDSIAANIAIDGLHDSEEIKEAARSAHIHELVACLPALYRTRVGERGMKLSGGEKQRVAIARALLQKPRLFVFDEATSSLDGRTEREVLKGIRRAASGITTLIIAHRLWTAAEADEILVLDGGRISERGTHDTLLQLDGRYASLWRAHMGNLTGHKSADESAGH